MNRIPQPYQFEDEQLQDAVAAERKLQAAIDNLKDQPEKAIIGHPVIEDLGRRALMAWDDATGPLDEPLELKQFLLVSVKSARDPDYARRLLESLASVI